MYYSFQLSTCTGTHLCIMASTLQKEEIMADRLALLRGKLVHAGIKPEIINRGDYGFQLSTSTGTF